MLVPTKWPVEYITAVSLLLVVVMRHSTLALPFAKAQVVKNQVLFLFILARYTQSKPENADLQKIASQLKLTHYE